MDRDRKTSQIGEDQSVDGWTRRIHAPSTVNVKIESIPVVSFHKPYSSTVMEKVRGYDENSYVMALVHMTDKSFLMFIDKTGDLESTLELNLAENEERTSIALF